MPGSEARDSLLGRLIAACAQAPWLTILLVAALTFGGWRAMQRSSLDALPDLSDVQVIVQTEWSGHSPDHVEDQITYPLSVALLGAPKVKAVRGLSDFGVSYVTVLFEDDTDLYWARSRVTEALSGANGRLPEGVAPTMGPDASSVGWVFQYALVDRSGKHTLSELRAIQEWNLRYALASVPGVAEVASVGGGLRQMQVSVDPTRARAAGVAFMEVAEAVRAANDEAGGHVIELAGHEQMIRGRGFVNSLDDVAQAVVRMSPEGVPIRVADVADLSFGPAEQRGVAELNGEGEVVGGVVVMRFGENALDVIDAVKLRLEEVQRGLPPGVEVVITYDRSELIRAAIDTLGDALIEEIIVVSLVIFVFLLHARSALVPVIVLPVAVTLSFIPLVAQGITANIMSLGGIVVAIGDMVDASIVIVENCNQRLARWQREGRPGRRIDALIEAMVEVGPALFFSLLVLTVSFLPVFTLSGTEGRLFSPLAWTKTWSMAWASVLSVTLVPALVALLIRGKVRSDEEHPLGRLLTRLYTPVVLFVVRWRRAVIAAAVLVVLATIPPLLALGREFMPPLNEGVVLYMPTAPPGMSVTEASRTVQTIDRVFKQFPEVSTVFGKMGRAGTATDPAPLSMAEVTVVLKPRGEWREGQTWDGLLAEMDAALQIPGMPNLFWMPVQTRTEMLATGVRSPVGVQVFGPDLESIERAAVEIERALSAVPGTRSASAERSTGGFYLDLEPKREALARLGLSVADLSEIVRMAIGGMPVTEVVQGRERYGISVRYAREARDTPEAIASLPIRGMDGTTVPLSAVATLRHETGAPMIRSEAGSLVGYVFVDPGERPLADYVEEAKATLNAAVALPPGVRVAWTGQYLSYERARAQLQLVLPATIALVLLLLYLNTRSLSETLIVLGSLPLSFTGAVWLLWALDYNMSVAVWVGVIALLGLDAETSVIMLLYLKMAYRRRKEEGRLNTFADLREVIVEGAAHRIRPKIMTVMTNFIGLGPVMLSQGTGADVMRRIAAPMLGGLFTSFALELLVYPAIFALWKGRGLPGGRE